jgi:hypothetical protein
MIIKQQAHVIAFASLVASIESLTDQGLEIAGLAEWLEVKPEYIAGVLNNLPAYQHLYN